MQKKINAEKARQGSRGTQVLIILVAGLSLLAIAFVGLGLYGWALPESDIPTAGVDTDVDTTPMERTPDSDAVVVAPSDEGAIPEGGIGATGSPD